MPSSELSGVEITTRQLAKCEWNLELASNFFNLLASLASAFFLLSVSLFFPASAHCRNAQQRHDFGEFFSDLANKKFELLASLASALKILIPPLELCMCFTTLHFFIIIIRRRSVGQGITHNVLPLFLLLCCNMFLTKLISAQLCLGE
jgi:hypothetical protein